MIVPDDDMDISSWSYQYARRMPPMNLVNRKLTKSLLDNVSC